MRLFLAIFLAILVTSVHALEIEGLFMPGDLIGGHQKLEKNCENCHVRLRETTQTQLCLDCHELVEKDIKDRKGFHGRNKKVASAECIVCHTEHKGRDEDIVKLNEDRFDHNLTDFKLKGKHQQTGCKECHLPEKKYRQASSNCISCHKDDDVHKNKLGDKCGQCHTSMAWSKIKFDHDKTDFPLRDSHQKVTCDSCHIKNKFKDTPKNCVACHAIKDVHQNRFGNRCQTCHREKKWNKTSFDHDVNTRFKLKDKHRLQTCKSCHASRKPVPVNKNKKPRDCYSCHRLDDVHRGAKGKKCQQCHQTQGWRDSNFDHDAETKFPLLGKHKEIQCQSCHLNDEKDMKISTDCYSCHRQDDSHNKQQGEQCGDCHNESSWQSDVRFDHDLSDFPLIGQHAVIACESCHLSTEFKNVESECVVCHQSQDTHKGSLGKNCQRCHNSNDWLIWEFDHSQTGFEIKGAHRELHCQQCHFKPLVDKRSIRSCRDCHRMDDIHNGGFGKNCGSCHQQDEFSSINRQSMKTLKRKTLE